VGRKAAGEDEGDPLGVCQHRALAVNAKGWPRDGSPFSADPAGLREWQRMVGSSVANILQSEVDSRGRKALFVDAVVGELTTEVGEQRQ
jgi:hypothetical protein